MRYMVCSVALIPLFACSSTEEEPTIELEFPAVDVGAGEEVEELCQSFTLDNDEPLYVNTVRMSAGLAWHHSNWFFVPESMYEGPDGTWTCNDRDWDQLATALAGGVIFAQSTQVTSETQQFQPGAAVVIPPRSRIVGQIHLINLSETALSTSIALELETIPADRMEIRLLPMSMTYVDLALPPRERSRFSSTCDFTQSYGGPLDFRVHYVLPHYHALGESLRLEAAGGDIDGQVVYENESAVGEPLGGTLDPPIEMNGADGFRFSCTFNNDRDEQVGWGIGDQEMCVLLAFVDGPLMFASLVESGTAPIDTPPDAIADFEGPCLTLGYTPR